MAQAESRRITSRDVAEAAGVSRTTVSFVLNDRADMAISDSTRRRVWAAARTLGYAPSPEARALRLGRSAVVLCLLPDWPIGGPFGVLLQRLSAELAVAGLTMLSHQRRPGDQLGQVLATLTPTAIVAMCDLSQAEIDLADKHGIEVVAFMGRVPHRDDVASFTQSDIGCLQVRALVTRGHTSIAYVSPHDRKLDWFSAPRLDGALQEARRLGARLTQFRLPADNKPSVGQLLGKSRTKGVTGICAYNDEVALSLMMAAHTHGVSVPDDVSLIGVDDSAIGKLTRPALSSIGFRLHHEAERLAAAITSAADDKKQTVSAHVLDLKMRASVRSL